MGWLSRKEKEEEEAVEQPVEGAPRYIDLGKYAGGQGGGMARGMTIKIAEIDGYDDLRALSNYVYDGNIMILDFTSIANDELSLKRIISELKRLVEDVNGDMAGISQNMLIVCPKGVKIDREKIRRGLGR
jgi:SepF-like predicted cell division protein (DUF552 family)